MPKWQAPCDVFPAWKRYKNKVRMKWPYILLTREKQMGERRASWLLNWKGAGCSGGCTVDPQWTLQSQAARALGKLGQLATHCCWPSASLRAWALDKEKQERRWRGALYGEWPNRRQVEEVMRMQWHGHTLKVKFRVTCDQTCTNSSHYIPTSL